MSRAEPSSNARLVAALLAAAAAAGCGGSGPAPSAAAPPKAPAVVLAEGVYALPSDTLQDWVSYANQVAVVRVASAEEIPVDEGLTGSGEWTTNRRAVLHVEEVLWRGQGQRPAADEVAVVVSGFVHKNGEVVPLLMHGEARLEVGERYVVPLLLQDAEWRIPGTSATPLVDGEVQPAQGQENSAAAEFRGHTPAEVKRRLERTRPDPAAARRADLQPYERWQEVAEERAASSPGGG